MKTNIFSFLFFKLLFISALLIILSSCSGGGGGSTSGTDFSVNLCMDSNATNFRLGLPCTCRQGFTVSTDGKTCTQDGSGGGSGGGGSLLCLDSHSTNFNSALPCTCISGYTVTSDGASCLVNGSSPPSYTYSQQFSAYTPAQADTTPCAGTVVTSRTMTCIRNDSVTVSNSNCSADPSPTSTVQSKSGTVSTTPTNSSLTNGTEYMTCSVGVSSGTRSIVCISNYHVEGASLASQNCYANVRTCSSMPTGASVATETWSTGTSSYGTCTISSCNSSQNYIKVGNSCVKCGADEIASGNVCISGTPDAKLYFNFNTAIWNVSTSSTKGWGYNNGYQVGNGSTSNITTPVTVNFGTGRYPKSIVANYNGTSMYAILDNGTVASWGANGNGQLGTGNTVTQTTPTVINVGGKTVKQIFTGSKSACAVTTDALLYCWGRNDYGELALGTGTVGTTVSTPTQVNLGTGRTVYEAKMADTVGIGMDMLCVILDNYALNCAGYNVNGQLGDATTTNKHVLTSISLGSGVTAKKIYFLIATSVDGSIGTCVIDNNNGLKCWGNNTYGKLGVGDTSYKYLPVSVNVGSGLTVKKLINSSTRYTVCAILSDDSLKCWGENAGGQVGDNTYVNRSAPVSVMVGVGRFVKNVFQFNNSWYAILDNNTLVSWGFNYRGQLGVGNTVDQITPQAVNLSGQLVSSIKTTDYLTCLATTTGNVWCAGDNTYGSVGVGVTGGLYSSFAQVNLGSGRTATELYVYSNSVCSLLDNNTVKCWGSGLYGKMGSGSSSDQNSPQLTL